MTDTQSEDRALEHVRLLCELGRFSEAAALARRTTATSPGEVEGWCLLAQALLGLDDDAGALAAASRAAALAPEFEWPHRLQSVALSSLGRHHESLDAAIESVRCEPYAWQTHARVAGASAVVDLYDQAETAVSRALELGPNESRAWVAAGGVAASKGDRRLAAQRYTHALALDPQDADAHAGLARTQLGNGNYANPSGLAAAATGFASATRADPRSPQYRRDIDTVLRIFLATAAYAVFVLCFVVARFTQHSGSAAARFVPVVLLVLPGIFVLRFVARLDREVRAHLFRTMRHGLVGVAVICEALAVFSIIAGAFVSTETRTTVVLTAILGAILARVALAADFRRHNPTPKARASRSLAIVAVAAFGGLGALMIYGGVGTPGGSVVIIVGLVFVALGVVVAVAFWRRR